MDLVSLSPGPGAPYFPSMGILHIVQQATILAAFLLWREAWPVAWKIWRAQAWRQQIVLEAFPMAVGGIVLGAMPLLAFSPRFVTVFSGRGDLANYDTRTAATFILFGIIVTAKHYLRQMRGFAGWVEQLQLAAICLVVSVGLAWVETHYLAIIDWVKACQ